MAEQVSGDTKKLGDVIEETKDLKESFETAKDKVAEAIEKINKLAEKVGQPLSTSISETMFDTAPIDTMINGMTTEQEQLESYDEDKDSNLLGKIWQGARNFAGGVTQASVGILEGMVDSAFTLTINGARAISSATGGKVSTDGFQSFAANFILKDFTSTATKFVGGKNYDENSYLAKAGKLTGTFLTYNALPGGTLVSEMAMGALSGYGQQMQKSLRAGKTIDAALQDAKGGAIKEAGTAAASYLVFAGAGKALSAVSKTHVGQAVGNTLSKGVDKFKETSIGKLMSKPVDKLHEFNYNNASKNLEKERAKLDTAKLKADSKPNLLNKHKVSKLEKNVAIAEENAFTKAIKAGKTDDAIAIAGKRAEDLSSQTASAQEQFRTEGTNKSKKASERLEKKSNSLKEDTSRVIEAQKLRDDIAAPEKLEKALDKKINDAKAQETAAKQEASAAKTDAKSAVEQAKKSREQFREAQTNLEKAESELKTAKATEQNYAEAKQKFDTARAERNTAQKDAQQAIENAKTTHKNATEAEAEKLSASEQFRKTETNLNDATSNYNDAKQKIASKEKPGRRDQNAIEHTGKAKETAEQNYAEAKQKFDTAQENATAAKQEASAAKTEAKSAVEQAKKSREQFRKTETNLEKAENELKTANAKAAEQNYAEAKQKFDTARAERNTAQENAQQAIENAKMTHKNAIEAPKRVEYVEKNATAIRENTEAADTAAKQLFRNEEISVYEDAKNAKNLTDLKAKSGDKDAIIQKAKAQDTAEKKAYEEAKKAYEDAKSAGKSAEELNKAKSDLTKAEDLWEKSVSKEVSKAENEIRINTRETLNSAKNIVEKTQPKIGVFTNPVQRTINNGLTVTAGSFSHVAVAASKMNDSSTANNILKSKDSDKNTESNTDNTDNKDDKTQNNDNGDNTQQYYPTSSTETGGSPGGGEVSSSNGSSVPQYRDSSVSTQAPTTTMTSPPTTAAPTTAMTSPPTTAAPTTAMTSPPTTAAPTATPITTAPSVTPSQTTTGGTYHTGGGYTGTGGYTENNTTLPTDGTTETTTGLDDIKDTLTDGTTSIEDVIKGSKYTKIPSTPSPVTTTSPSGGSSAVIPIAAGLSAAAAAGIGAKAYMDRKKNNDNGEDEDEFDTDEWSGDDSVDIQYDDSSDNENYLDTDDDYTYQTADNSEKYDARSSDELADLQ